MPSVFFLVLMPLLAARAGEEPVTNENPVPNLNSPTAIPERLVCDGLPYIENGVAMAPARPVCDFLRAKLSVADGLLTIGKNFDEPNIARTVSMRIGGKSAQVWDGGVSRNVVLPKATESRLGTVFVPAKFLVEILGGELLAEQKSKSMSVRDGARVGTFSSNYDGPYRGTDAAYVTISNRVGRALSLRLSGPQKLRFEVANNSKISVQMKPGLYYYQAGCAGMQTIKSARRLLAGRRTTWAWGKN